MKKVLKILILCVIFSISFVGLCFADDIINEPISNAYHSMFLPINANHLNNIPMYQVNDSVADIYSIRRRVNERTMMAVAGGGDKRHIYKARMIIGGALLSIIPFGVAAMSSLGLSGYELGYCYFFVTGLSPLISILMMFTNGHLYWLESNKHTTTYDHQTEDFLNRQLRKANWLIVAGVLFTIPSGILSIYTFVAGSSVEGLFLLLGGLVMLVFSYYFCYNGFTIRAKTKWKLETLFEVNENGASLRLSW